MSRYGLESKTSESVAPSAQVLALKVLGQHDVLHWKCYNEVHEVPSQLTRHSVFSYCGKLLGHLSVCSWLRVAVASIKRIVNHLTSGWDDEVLDDQLISFLEEKACEVERSDFAQGKWDVKGNKARVWVDASSQAL